LSPGASSTDLDKKPADSAIIRRQRASPVAVFLACASRLIGSVTSRGKEFQLPVLASADWLILLIYGFFVLSAGLSLAPSIAGSRDYLLAGRKLPAWLCSLAMIGASMGSLEVLGMGAAGARYGLKSIAVYALGSIPAMLFAALVLMPVLYGAASTPAASVRSIPEYLGLRFDQKTRALNAVLFVALALFAAGISLYAMARVFVALHVFDNVANQLGLSHSGTTVLSMTLPAALVLIYVLLGGLGAAMYNQFLQFCVIVAGLLPVVLLALQRVGGWSGLQAAVPAGLQNGGATGGHSPSLGVVALVLGVGFVMGGSTWCTDFRLLQTAMAAKTAHAAQRTPLIAAALRIFVPMLLILPGFLALGMPTPRTTISIHNENGTIVHDITVVPAAIEQGQGLVPAKADPATGQPMKWADGRVALDYALAAPNMLLALLPSGLLGLGLAALLACLMSGVAAGITASNTVFACDIYQAFLKKDATDKQILKAARWATVGSMLLAVAVACAAMRFNDLLDAVVLVFAVVNAPLFATLLLGLLCKRFNGHGAFAGQIAGVIAALVHHGTALPRGEQRGIHGGWIAVMHHAPSDLALGLGTAAFAFVVSLLVTIAVSLCTEARSATALAGLTVSSTAKPDKGSMWKRLEIIFAAIILLTAIAVNLIFLL
jgi:solute:Na+ symporter, SSS family